MISFKYRVKIKLKITLFVAIHIIMKFIILFRLKNSKLIKMKYLIIVTL